MQVLVSLAEHTELLLNKVLAVQREHWACLRSEEHALAVDTIFRGGGSRRKRSRSGD